MPKQKGPVYYTGTHGDACFYKMDGQYYVRKKSSLSGKRVKQAPSFELTRVYADLLAQASRLAAAVYRPLPREQKNLALYRAMTGEALRMLKQGVNTEIISTQLEAYCAPKVVKAKQRSAVRPHATDKTKHIKARILNILDEYTQPQKDAAPADVVTQKRLTGTTKARRGMHVASMGNIHFAFPKQVRVYITPGGKLEVRLTNRTRMKKENELVAME
jgi:hypothetical protein